MAWSALLWHLFHCFTHNPKCHQHWNETSTRFVGSIKVEFARCKTVMLLSKSYHCCPRESWANFDGLIFFTHLIFSCAARIYFQSWICKVCRMCLHLINFDKLIYFPFMFILRCPHVLLRENIWDFVIASLNQNMWKGVQGSVSKNISFSAKEILDWTRTPPFG